MHRRVFLTGLLGATFAPNLARADGGFNPQADLEVSGRYFPYLFANRMAAQQGADFAGLLPAVEAMCGDEVRAFTDYGPALRVGENASPYDLSLVNARDALADIVEQARTRRVVILNEAHHISRCRAFAETVALALAPFGFKHLAAEAMPHDTATFAAAINAGGPITTAKGVYNRDPCFAELFRSAHAAGYTLHAYDESPKTATSREDAIEQRDGGEAQNLLTLLKTYPQDRFLIYCGFDHIDKTNRPPKRMAARLIDAGVNPLCVAQAYTVPGPINDSAGLDPILDHFKPATPISLYKTDGAPLMLSQRQADICVYHPRLDYVAGRPGWLAIAPGRRRYDIDLSDVKRDADALIQAVRDDESALAANVVPSDQFPITSDMKSAALFLKPGRYRIYVDQLMSRQMLGTITVSA